MKACSKRKSDDITEIDSWLQLHNLCFISLPFYNLFPGSFRIQPLKTPYGLPAEQDMADTYINSKGELIVRRLLEPIDPKAIES